MSPTNNKARKSCIQANDSFIFANYSCFAFSQSKQAEAIVKRKTAREQAFVPPVEDTKTATKPKKSKSINKVMNLSVECNHGHDGAIKGIHCVMAPTWPPCLSLCILLGMLANHPYYCKITILS